MKISWRYLKSLYKPLSLLILLSAAIAPLKVADALGNYLIVAMLKNHSTSKDTEVPEGWKLKEWKGKADFDVVNTETGEALHLKSNSTSTALYRDMDFDVKEYPYINWRWKVEKLPEGADVREKAKDDQAAQVYVIFPKWPSTVNSRILGYIWDTSAPQGSSVESAKYPAMKYIVVRSGSENLGAWLAEKRNVYEDYRKLFNEEPPRAGSIAVMIDSDDTGSSAESFVGNIFLSRD